MNVQEFEIEFDPTVGQEFEIDISNMVQEVVPDLIDMEITPTEEEQTFTPPEGDAYGNIKVNPIPNDYTMTSIEDGVLVFSRGIEVNGEEVIL